MTRLVIILMLFPLFAFSQKKSHSDDVQKIKIRKNSNLIIETNSSDVFYIGTNNIIVLRGQGVFQYSLTINNGILTQNFELTNDSSVAFDVNVNNTNPTYITFSNNRSTFRQKYRNKPIPNPYFCLNVQNRRRIGGEISDSTFRDASAANVNMFGFDYGLTMRLVSFKIKKVTSDNKISNFSLQNVDIRAITKDAKSGDIFIFYDILVEMCEPKEQRQINGLTFLIK